MIELILGCDISIFRERTGKSGIESIIAIIRANKVPSNNKFIVGGISAKDRLMPNISPMYLTPAVIDSDLNNTHAIVTINSVYTCDHKPSFLGNSVYFSNIRIAKYKSPQQRNVQLAPCHIPVRSQTTKIFRIHFLFGTLFPPSGI